MKLLKNGLSIFLLSITPFAFSVSSAELKVPEHIQLLNLNGEKQSIQLFIRNRDYPLSPGINALRVRYRDLIESADDDSHDTIKSDEVVIHFEAKGDENLIYRLVAPRPETTDEAYAFAKKPSFQIYQASELIPQVKPTFVAPPTPSLPPQPKLVDGAQNQAVNNKAAEMLEYWWQQADDETRATFLKKVIQNN